MEIFDGHRALPRALSQPCVALGNFDGVHRGHQALLEAAVSAARARGGEAVAYTFDPHPMAVLTPQLAPQLLTSLERRLELISDCGIDVCIVEPFNRELAAMDPDQFAAILADVVGARRVVVGYDFTYGKNRAGNVETLRAYGAGHEFDVECVAPITEQGVVVSSTKIRELLTAGDVAGAAALLKRDFDVDGPVIRGASRGRSIGFPTANVQPGPILLPAPGIYAGRVRVPRDGTHTWHAAAISLGTNPTFETAAALSLEAYVLDFDGDLYDRTVRVAFAARLRGEKKFDDVDALVAQIRRDVAATRDLIRAKE